MMLQTPNPFEIDIASMLAPLIIILILFLLMVFMVGLYMKARVFLVILIVFIFSMVMGGISLGFGENIPFTPYIQLFFMCFQGLIFTLTTIKVFTKKY